MLQKIKEDLLSRTNNLLRMNVTERTMKDDSCCCFCPIVCGMRLMGVGLIFTGIFKLGGTVGAAM